VRNAPQVSTARARVTRPLCCAAEPPVNDRTGEAVAPGVHREGLGRIGG
jgi:hypothetical protein